LNKRKILFKMTTKTYLSGSEISRVTGINVAHINIRGRVEAWPGVPVEAKKKKWRVPSVFAAERFQIPEAEFVAEVLKKGGAR
jgi:hypothetical protein